MFLKGLFVKVFKSRDCVVKSSLFTKQQNFRLIQIESICRGQNKCDRKIEICFGTGRKHCEKGRKCWSPAFSSFPAMFSRAFYFRVVRNCDCVVKSLAFTTNSRVLTTLKQRAFENNGNHHFLHFPQCFLFFPMQLSNYEPLLFCRRQMF